MLLRCEDCGAGVEGAPAAIDLEAEARALTTTAAAGEALLVAANRASWQAAIGGEGWAAIDRRPGRLLLTPRSLRLLAERTGLDAGDVRFPAIARNQGWMWQTLLNGLTFHPNFAREVRAGRLRPGNARGRFAFFADLVATVLAAPLVALASLPLELIAVLARRGGELVAPVSAGTGHGDGARRAVSPGARAG